MLVVGILIGCDHLANLAGNCLWLAVMFEQSIHRRETTVTDMTIELMLCGYPMVCE